MELIATQNARIKTNHFDMAPFPDPNPLSAFGASILASFGGPTCAPQLKRRLRPWPSGSPTLDLTEGPSSPEPLCVESNKSLNYKKYAWNYFPRIPNYITIKKAQLTRFGSAIAKGRDGEGPA